MIYRWHICPASPEYQLTVRGRVIRFEMHPFCGPMPCDKNGKGIHLVPSHPFWAAVTEWDRERTRAAQEAAKVTP